MYIFALGVTILFGVHLVPSFVEFRHRMITSLGKVLYLGLFSATSLVGFILILNGKSKIGFRPLWDAPAWSIYIVAVLVLLSLIFIVSAYLQSNIRRFNRHPMLWGVILWAVAHLIANGDLASLLFFGTFCVFSLFHIISANLRGATKQVIKYPFTKDAVIMFTGLVLFGVFLYLHPYLFGVAVV